MAVTWKQAADAADAFLAAAEPGTVVLRDPFDVWQDDEVFVFVRTPASFDDRILVVTKADLKVSLVLDPIGGPEPYPLLAPLQEADEA